MTLLAAGIALGGVRALEAQGSTSDLGYAVPPGYVEQRAGDVIVLLPAAPNEATPCLYGIAPTRPATGNLEADAEAALLEAVVPGWRRLDDRHAAMRGVAAHGWPYAWYRAAFEGVLGGERQAVNAMALVLPADRGRVHVVWGMGSISRCLLDDPTFEWFFHSLRPPAWSSDGGEALARLLVGSWRFTASAGLQQLHFTADGRFERDVGIRARVGITERSSATATGGWFALRDGDLALVPDHRPQSPDRYRVRLYDEWFLGEWRRAIALFDDAAAPPLVITYYRVDQGAR